jgi:DNA-binding CsgD family transcriptional regulator
MLVATGLSNAEIGRRLFVSPRTAETHRSNIMRKLNLRSQTDAVLLAVRRGFVLAS